MTYPKPEESADSELTTLFDEDLKNKNFNDNQFCFI